MDERLQRTIAASNHEAVPLREAIGKATRREQRISSMIVDRTRLRNRVSQPDAVALYSTHSLETRFLGITRHMFQVQGAIVPV
ncbi:MAG: hypothetical protein KME42_15155 [Tildeniella nuda ZEHNDER 1965/U140]|nr:hypothetical protein [Tildeniella nuda ZEHNDER 1965/U140]